MTRFFLSCVGNVMNIHQGGNMWATWESYLCAARDVLGLRLKTHKAYAYWEKAARQGGFRIVHEKFCIVSDFPEYIKTDVACRPHCATGPSHRWRDGWSIYHLNGVRVPAWLVETPAEQLDPQCFAREANAEIRREFIRKIGVERLCAKLGSKLLDKRGTYELHLVDLGGRTGRHPYLKMLNPSIGTWHMEAVDETCTTVVQALNFRNGGAFRHLASLT